MSAISQQTELLATEFAHVLSALPPRETDATMGQFWLSVVSKLQAINPDSDLHFWSTIHQKVPVPAEVIQRAIREFDEKETVEEFNRTRETGGFCFDDFYGDLERLVRSSDDAPVQPQGIVLSDRDWTAFMAALDDPAEPNEALKDLMHEFGPWKDSAAGKPITP